MPLSKGGMIDMAPPSVLGSEARSASLANAGCGFPIGTSLALAAETGQPAQTVRMLPFLPTAGPLGRASAGLAWSTVQKRGCALRARLRPVPEFRSLPASDWARRAVPRWARPAHGPAVHRWRRRAPRAGLRPGPAKDSLGQPGIVSSRSRRSRRDLAPDFPTPRRFPSRRQAARRRPIRLGPTVTPRDPGSSGMLILARA